jgi:hypothetical protein
MLWETKGQLWIGQYQARHCKGMMGFIHISWMDVLGISLPIIYLLNRSSERDSWGLEIVD